MARQPTNRPSNKPSKLAPKTIKLDAKIVPTFVPRSLLEGSWGVSWRGLGGCFGSSWGVLGPLGGVLAPRWPQEPKMLQNPNVGSPYWGPCWDPKSIKIGPKSDPKSDHFFDHFLDRLLERFGANLAPTWLPKPSQNGGKLVSKSMQVGMSIFKLFLKGFRHAFY